MTLYQLHLYRVTVEVSDDPYHGEYVALVQAHNKVEARPLARKAALASYRLGAGGYALQPTAEVISCDPYILPEQPDIIAVGLA